MDDVKEIRCDLLGSGRKFGIVVSRFNEFISAELLRGTIDTLTRHGVAGGDISVVWVPGSFEIPSMASRMIASDNYDAVICLGAVIRGETPHFDFIASEAAKGIARVGMESSVPCVFGVITTDTLEQALDRAGIKSGNKGREAARTAIEMVNLYSAV